MKEFCRDCKFGDLLTHGQPYDDGNGISVHFGSPEIIRRCIKIKRSARELYTENLDIECTTGQFVEDEKKQIEAV